MLLGGYFIRVPLLHSERGDGYSGPDALFETGFTLVLALELSKQRQRENQRRITLRWQL